MKRRWITPVLLAAMWIFAAAVYPRLPDHIPVHWDLHGHANRWGGRTSAFLAPAIATGIAVLLWVLPRIDPRRAHWARFPDEVNLIVNVLVLFFGWIEAVSLGAALGWNVDVGRAVMAGVGALFIAIGNYLPRIRSNWWLGIRTPWTLESERVWRETHRVAGRTFVAGGLLAVAGTFIRAPIGDVLVFAALVGAGLVPAVYSYLAWRRESAERAS